MPRKKVRARRGLKLACKGWRQEAILRMLQNNLENAEKPEELIVYGGSGKVARNWECYDAIVGALKRLEKDETLLVQSGKPVGVFTTTANSPRVLIANANLVPRWSTWEVFRDLEEKGLMMYGQMTAGGWAYIGTQGILQGTYETFAACAKKNFGGSLKGRLVLTGGLGGMGGAQPLAVTMNGGVCLAVECDERKIDRRVEIGYCHLKANDLSEALSLAMDAKRSGRPQSIGLVGNCADTHPRIADSNIVPDVVTDQTSAHDELNGYIPKGLSMERAARLRTTNPDEYRRRAFASIGIHVKAMLLLQRKGAVVFDYGNNIRGQALNAGVRDAFAFKGFVPLYIRPMFCEGRGPFRWVAMSGDPEDILRTDKVIMREFRDNKQLVSWIKLAEEKVPFEGLPARVCWLGYGERARFGLIINKMVREKQLRGPIVMTRDHLDCGSVASPNRETEGMRDGSDAVADWPLLNALINTAAGADLIAVHNGGGVGIGYSTHAGLLVIADGTHDADDRIRRVLTTDPGMGIIRHADAGYPEAIAAAKKNKVKIPMLKTS